MKKNKWLTVFLIVAGVMPWSMIVLLLLQMRSTISQQLETKNISIVEVTDTIINEQPKFFSQSPQEGLEEALSYYGLEHKDIVFAQAILETGHFKSEMCLKYNNLFGLYNNKEKRYCRFKHWTESVIAYKEWIQRKYQSPKDYYAFLEEINYAENKNYTRVLKEIVDKIKNDKRRYIERDSFT